jgi:hypothetical protein
MLIDSDTANSTGGAIMRSERGPAHVERALRRRETLWQLGALLKVIVGVPLTLLAPLAFAAIGYTVDSRLHLLGRAFWQWFVLATAIVVPILLWTERRHGARLLTEMARGATLPNPLTGDWPVASGMTFSTWTAYRHPRAFTGGVIEILLTGPRLVLSALDHWRLRRRLGRANTRDAATVLAQLARHDRGRPAKSLQRADQTPEQLMHALNYLMMYEWVAAAEGRDHVYLLPDARALFQSRGEGT